MTNEIIHQNDIDVKSITDIELANRLSGFGIDTRHLSRFLSKNYPELLQETIERTKFLDEHFSRNGGSTPFGARIFCLMNNIHSHPTCNRPGCTNKVNWSHHMFQNYCGAECVGKDPKVIERRENTSLKNNGVTNVLRSKEVQLRIRQRQTELYGGVGFASQKTNAKIQGTMEDRYGVKYAAQSSEIMEKVFERNLEKYGNKCSLHGEEIEKKSIETNMSRRGVPYPMMSEEVLQKSRETWMKNLGVDNPQKAESVRMKTQHTVEEIYGGPAPACSKEVQEKMRNTCFRNHNRYHYSQTEEYHNRVHRKYTNPKYPDLSFDSSWEFKVYDFLTENNIPFEYHIEPIPYEYDGETHYYFPDFRINGRIYEVKGDNFFRINEETGKEEMYCTWRDPDWSDERYEWECRKQEAKHQCMLRNNVVILREQDIKNITMQTFE